MSILRQIVAGALILTLSGCAALRPGENAGRGEVRLFLQAPSAKSVAVAGNFNHWDPAAAPLSGPDKNGIWSIMPSLPPGRHEYLFVIDGQAWLPDPAAPLAEDGFGGKNSVVLVN